MNNLFNLFYTIALWSYTISAFFTHAIIYSLTKYFVKNKREWSFILTKPFISLSFSLFACPLTINGLENIQQDKNFIIASNHQSILDIFIHFKGLTKPISFFAKQELTKIPILGWNIKEQGHFIVDRKRPKKAVKQLAEVKAHLISGYSAIFFPEGTRSLDDSVGPFKRGAFLLAAQTGTTIIPAYIHGSNHVIHKTRHLSMPSKLSVTYGKPIPVERAKTKIEEKEIAEKLLKKVRDEMLSLSGGRA
ncbi:hypothetical protein DID80_00285 [Candidatus Marinamargulisbacteria bacterium SCGC AAA071-K20]|nr:hypothetical protein DID80_00285 [Candidatus Marinamargulisbacteria bacterium SCGC AAA071-K20]